MSCGFTGRISFLFDLGITAGVSLFTLGSALTG